MNNETKTIVAPIFTIENPTIEVFKKIKYGTEFIYIKDSRVARAVTNLTGRVTLSSTDLVTLKAMGFNFKVVLEGEDTL